MSFRTYSTICVLEEAKGLDVGVNYRNDKAVASFTKAFATVVQKTTVEKLKNTQFCSFTIDGSTDFTGDDLENIYIRTVHSGRVEDTFLHIGNVLNLAPANTYMSMSRKCLQNFTLQMKCSQNSSVSLQMEQQICRV
ncbi:hypothetical protein DPMN_120603 [Dreissena polymorpha]|uniref:Uncharacterized protein n=1 Tax=Dreissena polymorpha TaxID=45954 RepID=A0A9D4GNY9_DREPO|nr:hypothetical protein DPMN_120603 [Dreissena polymorpha]